MLQRDNGISNLRANQTNPCALISTIPTAKGWIQISSDLFAKRCRVAESSVNDVGWYVVAYILLRLLIASVRFK